MPPGQIPVSPPASTPFSRSTTSLEPSTVSQYAIEQPITPPPITITSPLRVSDIYSRGISLKISVRGSTPWLRSFRQDFAKTNEPRPIATSHAIVDFRYHG